MRLAARTSLLGLIAAILILIVLSLSDGVEAVNGQSPTHDRNINGGGYPSQHVTQTHHIYYEEVPVIEWAGDPIVLPHSESMLDAHRDSVSNVVMGGGGPSGNPYAPIYLEGPTFAEPGSTINYNIKLANYELYTYTYGLSNTLPAGIEYIPGSASTELTYDPQTRTMSWQGMLEPGKLDYIVTDNTTPLNYIDLADFGVGNLCDPFIANGEPCDDVLVTFNLGISNRSTHLFGEEMVEVVLSSNGVALVSDDPANNPTSAHNQWLPDSVTPGHLLAGLWRDSDMTTGGRWHAAIITGWIAGHDVFYAQWHDAPHKNDVDVTVRHAIAILLDGDTGHTGEVYYIYDNVSDPQQTINLGYTIGIEDKLGTRGTTWAYSGCCGDPMPPVGFPPNPGTTLRLTPYLFGSGNDYIRTFSYEVEVTGVVPQMVANTAYATSNSPDPTVSFMWYTDYLFVRLMTYIPVALAQGNE